MLKLHSPKSGALAVLVAASLGLAACSSNDDNGISGILDGDTDDTVVDGDADAGGDDAGGDSELNPSLVNLDLVLDSTSTVPPANVDGATGTGSV